MSSSVFSTVLTDRAPFLRGWRVALPSLALSSACARPLTERSSLLARGMDSEDAVVGGGAPVVAGGACSGALVAGGSTGWAGRFSAAAPAPQSPLSTAAPSVCGAGADGRLLGSAG